MKSQFSSTSARIPQCNIAPKARKLRFEPLEARQMLSAGGDLGFGSAFRLGGGGFDEGQAVATDPADNIYVTGSFQGTADFDSTSATFNLTAGCRRDAFVAKYSSAGELLWARQIGGRKSDLGYGIAVASDGSVYTTGFFQGTADFDPGPGTYNLTSTGNDDIFVSKLDSAGNFVWARQMGGKCSDIGRDIAVGADGTVYVTGDFQKSADFGLLADKPGPSKPDKHQCHATNGNSDLTSAGATDIFVSRIDADGNTLWAQRFGGKQNDHGFGLAVGTDGEVYTTGDFRHTVDFDPGAGTHELTSAGQADIFALKLDADGAFLGVRRMGGKCKDIGYDIAVSADRSVFITGRFRATADFDSGEATYKLTSAGQSDVFVAKLDPAGNFAWARQFGGKTDDRGFAIVLGEDGSVFTAGSFRTTADFDPGPGTFNLTSEGKNDVFVSQLDSAGNFVWAGRMGGTKADAAHGIAATSDGGLCAVGSFERVADFDPSEGTFNLTSAAKTDVFVTRFYSSQPEVAVPDSLPWSNIDTITIIFGGDAGVQLNDLVIAGVNVEDYFATYGVSFSYDSTTFTATWTLGCKVDTDKLLIQLDDGLPTVEYIFASGTEWNSWFLDALDAEGLGHPTIPRMGYRLFGEEPAAPLTCNSLNELIASPQTNGELLFRFNVLVGDVTMDGFVDATDFADVRNAVYTWPGYGDYSIWADIQADAFIDASDLADVRNHIYT